MTMTHTPDPPISPTDAAERLRLRWPIQFQLLVPMVAVVLLASLLATAITAYWIARRVRNEQSDNLRRVVETLGQGAVSADQ